MAEEYFSALQYDDRMLLRDEEASNSACLHTYHHTIMNSEPTGSHGWHTGFCCVYMILVVGFGDKANGQRGSIQENTEMESMG